MSYQRNKALNKIKTAELRHDQEDFRLPTALPQDERYKILAEETFIIYSTK